MNDYKFKYQFKKEDAYDIARHIGIHTKERGSELTFKTCPYCRGGNSKDEYSFAINTKTGMFKCLRATCDRKGFIWTLAQDFDFKLTNEFTRYYEKQSEYKKLSQPKEPIIPKAEAIQFLESRGISEDTAKAFQITIRNDNADTLVFPIFNSAKELVNIKYRNTKWKKGDKGNKEWFEKDCAPYLFGVQTFNGSYDKFVITEGQMDAMACYESGIENCFSVLGGKNSFTWYPACYDFIEKFSEIIIFGDCEHDEITLVDGIKARFKKKIRVVRVADYKDCKDANDILIKYGKEQVKACVDNAEMLPMNNVVDLADVKSIDVFKIDKLATGISQVDRLLYGGIPFGGVTLVSGKAGEGKSTLASQILVNAIYQKHKCFAYSGELPNSLFRAWMDFQVCGGNRIFDAQNRWGDKEYSISQSNRQQISNWYRGNLYIYDDSNIDGEETESLTKLIERVIIQYGVDVILLDNLMTAMDFDSATGDDKYERQSAFVKHLARIGKEFNVLILLVAHKRKNNFGTNGNDEIMGSSDIGNLAMLNISYEKNDKIDPEKRLCKVVKNRLFGKTETEGFILEYDERSKRIFGQHDNKNFDYGWDKTTFDERVKGKINFDIQIDDSEKDILGETTDDDDTPFD